MASELAAEVVKQPMNDLARKKAKEVRTCLHCHRVQACDDRKTVHTTLNF